MPALAIAIGDRIGLFVGHSSFMPVEEECSLSEEGVNPGIKLVIAFDICAEAKTRA